MDRVTLRDEGAVAHVVVSHPGKFNAMSRAMWHELKVVFQDLNQRAGLRCVIVAGEGGHFCAGGDIAEYPGFRFDEAALREFHEINVWGGLQAVLDCPVPVIAQIEGNCMGAGVEIASCCDLRVAGRSARFGAPIARLGFPMAPREAQLVMREAGTSVARAMLLEAAVFDAEQMLNRGFLNAVVADIDVQNDAGQRAARVALLAPRAARLNKQTIRSLLAQGASEQLLGNAYAYADSAEHREGISAFLAKRPPVF
ncbi:enoyl-CoA hydratase [Hydrogenophaga crassostreae]|uniref:Enoyl-CoA hydratase n=1 Tax=Hydrogenophaga crassostreae TaxID=1763535 RepID=A0A167I3L8_9BURK|nr:enoyl-CoA hydratase-related protein [Hydrogenophaga crassostreae]AOW15629.1 enoyl-CoA hydratase [Hydrogenophaga crassostreae]OAD42092.1 enoyl-CoA hydratase [Hydrogenophaga crassostreae]